MDADRKAYFKCSMYYMRKYFGLREIILLAILLGIGLTLFITSGVYFILILFGVCLLIIGIAFILFLWTAISGYKVDFEKLGIAKKVLFFKEDHIEAVSLDKYGKELYKETHSYEKLDKIAVKKDVIYIYAQVSVFYYITAGSLSDEDRRKIVELLHERVKNEETFKIKKTYRIYPKKKRMTRASLGLTMDNENPDKNRGGKI